MKASIDSKEKKYSIYCHICPNGKRYVGMTSDELKVRFGNGNHYSRKTRFGMAIQKFGWKNITSEILETELSFEEACEKEKYYISLYKTTQEEFGYNMAAGGNIKVVIGRTLSENTRKKISNSNKGQKRSDETKRKLRISHIGKESHNVRPVIKMDLQEKNIEEYISIAEAVRRNSSVDRGNIWRCCAGRRKTAGGYKWKYK